MGIVLNKQGKLEESIDIKKHFLSSQMMLRSRIMGNTPAEQDKFEEALIYTIKH